MTLKKTLFLILLSFSYFNFASEIRGFAPDFLGKEVTIYTYSDYITLSKVKLKTSTVNLKDSSFTLNIDIKRVIKVLLEIGNMEAELYLSPNTDYEIYYKLPDDTPKSFAKQKATIYFKNLDSSDINYKILQYNNWIDEYIYVNKFSIVQHGILPHIDTFKRYAYEAYKNEKNPYFTNYVRFNIANLEKLKVSAKYHKPKLASYLEYIKPFPVYAYNDQYMEYVKGLYSDDFNSFPTQIKSDIVLAINHASPSRLMLAMKRNPMYEKPELRELLMVNMLGKAYYTRQYNRKNIQVMLDSIIKFSRFQSGGQAAKNILKQVTRVETGYIAPEFSFIDDNEVIKLEEQKDKFVYLSFFATWSSDAVKDLKLMEELHAKYNEHVTFISFCIDEDKTTFDVFKKENPTMQWPIIYIGDNHELAKKYVVSSVPYYVLIDQEGLISRSPALSPSPDGLYKTIENTFKYIKVEMEK